MSIIFICVVVHSLCKTYIFKHYFDLALVINLIFKLKNSLNFLKSLFILIKNLKVSDSFQQNFLVVLPQDWFFLDDGILIEESFLENVYEGLLFITVFFVFFNSDIFPLDYLYKLFNNDFGLMDVLNLPPAISKLLY